MDKRDLRNRIIDAAEKLLLEKGYGGASIDAIAAAAGTSKGGFFHYFDNKSVMLMAMIERSLERFSASVRSCADFLPDMPAKLLKAHVLVWMRERGQMPPEQMTFMAELRDESIRQCIAEHKRRHAELIRPPELPEATFDLVLLVCSAIGLDSFMKGMTPDEAVEYRQRIAQELFRVIDQAMGATWDATAINREFMAGPWPTSKEE